MTIARGLYIGPRRLLGIAACSRHRTGPAASRWAESVHRDRAAWQRSEPNSFIRATLDKFPEGASITTDDTIYFGFGFEGIVTPDGRNAVMGCVMQYLLR